MYKKWIRVIAIFVLAIILFTGAIRVDNYNQSIINSTIVSDEDDLHLWEQGQILYKGDKYQYKNNIKTYLLMGIDSMEEVTPKDGEANGGQSDALFLLIVDDEEKQWSIIAVNRNTMTGVSLYDENGEYLWDMYAQICVQHGFGDGMEQSCERTVQTLSRTLYDLPIDGYFSINMGAIPAFNDALSGVNVTSMDEIDMPEIGVRICEGDSVTLKGMQAWGYLVWRDESQPDSATRRLERQKQYIKSAYSQLADCSIAEKLDIINKALDITQKYTVIDMPVVDIGYQILLYEKNLDEIYSLPGVEVAGDRFVEYYLDEEKTLEMLIHTYYTKVN